MFSSMPIEVLLLFGVNAAMLLAAVVFGIFVYPHREWTEETKRRPRSFVSNAFFREYWYFVIGPFKRKLVKWGVSPNTLTWWGFILSIAGGTCFAFGKFGMGGWLVILAATCDIYDGQLARLRAISLKSGAFLDSTLDRIGEVAIFYGLTRYFRHDDVMFLIIFFGFAASQVVSYSRARAEGLGFPKLGQRGFFQRAERMIVLSIAMPMVPVVEYYWGKGELLAKVAIIFLCVGSAQTALSRSIGIYKGIRKEEK